MIWHVDILTLFPEMFPGFLQYSLAGKALKNNCWSYQAHALREFGLGNHKAVDDTPFGGGAGMVIRSDVLGNAIDATYPHDGRPMIYLSPRGKPLTQRNIERFSSSQGMYILCGRYEGIDERILHHYDIEEVSIGDYILSGGEPAALTLMDACIRLLPGVMGSLHSISEESFANGMLEYPHYTKPVTWRNQSVPSVLRSGNHEAIALWRKEQSKQLTRLRRPDLWKEYSNT